MLPFLKPDQASVAGLIIKHRPSDNPEQNQDDPEAACRACAQELISAIHRKDVNAVMEALKDAFTLFESMPHEEAEPEYAPEGSFKSQNVKAKE